ncbi:DUF7668 domain-containing protein [Acidithiobacillus sp.]
MNDQIKETVRFIVNALSVGDMQSLVRQKLLNPDEMDGTLEVIHQYNKHMIAIPPEGWALVDVYCCSQPGHINGQKDVYDIDIPLWTEEEGRSDLMLKINVNHGFVKILDVLVP